MRRRVLLGLVAGAGSLGFCFVVYWLMVILIDRHPAFIPNAERRAAMFRFLAQRQHGSRRPRQGDYWIF